MKYVTVCADGMADWPLKERNNQTPMELAKKKTMDYLAFNGIVGSVKTIPDGMSPGSDTANMALLGYDPEKYYTGRSPFEAISMGVGLADEDVTFRCNLVTLREDEELEFSQRVIIDHGADDISSQEASELMKVIDHHFSSEHIAFYPGVSYRNLMKWKNAPGNFKLIPPHDILMQPIGDFLPSNKDDDNLIIREFMEKSYELLKNHPINLARKKQGLHPANSIWIWGEGKKPKLQSFAKKYAVNGAVISAVDLVKGIGICAGMTSIDVQGATGTLDTNYAGKVEAAIQALHDNHDFVYIHIEAPDECGHKGNIQDKIRAIELIDSEILAPLRKNLSQYFGDYRIMVLPDHPTPIELRTHVDDPVPFLIYDSTESKQLEPELSFCFSEQTAAKNGPFIPHGFKLMDIFLQREGCCGEHEEGVQ